MQIKHTDINVFQVSMQTGFLNDKSGSAPVTFLGNVYINVKNDQSLQWANISLSKYKLDRILKNQQELLKWWLLKWKILTMRDVKKAKMKSWYLR